ncbi:MAG: hypothetical protein LBT59_08580 [Clostridiales bacterium]|jgi:ABC-2 type transport system permease protein|nr:hypothetical protein [Clostridiales bacterium]
MIGKLFILNLKALLSGIFRIGSGKSGKLRISFVIYVGLALVLSFFMLFYALFSSICQAFFDSGLGFMYFATLGTLIFGLCVISTMFAASAMVFGAKDNELLLALPIKPSHILISRLMALLASEYGVALLACVAAFLPWVAGGYATGIGIVFLVLGTLLLPPMALSVALFLAWILSSVSTRLRHKNIISLAISISFFLAYMYFYMNLQGYMNQLMANGQELAEAFKRAMPPFYAFGASIANADFARFFIFFVWAVTPFVLALMLLGAKYGQVLTSSKGVPKTAYKERDIPAKTQLRALVGKEMAKFWSRPMVVMNSSIGSVFLLLSPLALVPQAGIMQQIETFSQMLNIPISVMFAAILAFLGSANTLSASLVSLEGKSLWIVKSVPIASKTILQAKIITHLLVSSIPCLFASAFFSLSGSAGDALLIFIVPQTAIVFMANLGIAINLFFPKLDWTNETYVVKQGISAMIALFGGMALFAGLGILYALALSSVLPATLFLWICAIVFAIVGAAAYSWLMKRGAIMFSELS